jgi:hypothetical protein
VCHTVNVVDVFTPVLSASAAPTSPPGGPATIDDSDSATRQADGSGGDTSPVDVYTARTHFHDSGEQWSDLVIARAFQTLSQAHVTAVWAFGLVCNVQHDSITDAFQEFELRTRTRYDVAMRESVPLWSTAFTLSVGLALAVGSIGCGFLRGDECFQEFGCRSEQNHRDWVLFGHFFHPPPFFSYSFKIRI